MIMEFHGSDHSELLFFAYNTGYTESMTNLTSTEPQQLPEDLANAVDVSMFQPVRIRSPDNIGPPPWAAQSSRYHGMAVHR